MFRRRQKHLIPASALPPLLLTLGGLALMWALLQQRATPGFIAVNRYSMVALLALAAVGIGLAIINRTRAERRFDATVRTAIERHIDALVQRRQQLRGSESPGPEASRWEQEMKHFIATQIAPLLNRRGERVLQERHLEVLHRIENRAAIAAAGRPNLSLSGPGVSLR